MLSRGGYEKSKILIADDDSSMVSVLCELLEASGYETCFAGEGADAVALAKKELPDLILCDWEMPAGKGSAVLFMLREKKETANIPVIILSGVKEPYMQENMKQLGARIRLYKISKPFRQSGRQFFPPTGPSSRAW